MCRFILVKFCNTEPCYFSCCHDNMLMVSISLSLSLSLLKVTLNELKGGKAEDKTPPAWFTSYMEKVNLLLVLIFNLLLNQS